MRILMTFTTTEAEQTKRVFGGPAWETSHTLEVFKLMHLEVELSHGGAMPLERFAEGFAHARAALVGQIRRPKVERTLETLATWATVARLRGATEIQWREDF